MRDPGLPPEGYQDIDGEGANYRLSPRRMKLADEAATRNPPGAVGEVRDVRLYWAIVVVDAYGDVDPANLCVEFYLYPNCEHYYGTLPQGLLPSPYAGQRLRAWTWQDNKGPRCAVEEIT